MYFASWDGWGPCHRETTVYTLISSGSVCLAWQYEAEEGEVLLDWIYWSQYLLYKHVFAPGAVESIQRKLSFYDLWLTLKWL